MKILYFGGGLGNQIFEYAFYLEIKDRFPNEKIRGIYLNSKFKEHVGGFEIERIFDVKFPKTSLYAKFLTFCTFIIKKINPNTKLCSLHNTHVNWNALVFNAFKSDLSFYHKRKDWIKFKHVQLSAQNQTVIESMNKYNSIALHVRRSDYLSPQYITILGNIATESYYKNAIEIAKSNYEDPHFFVFSDDIDWCKKHLNLSEKVIFIDWNTGKNSYLDLYLMTHAKCNIIANSTFSYWGAYLNKNNPIVIYPKKWINTDYYPQIFPENWIGLDS